MRCITLLFITEIEKKMVFYFTMGVISTVADKLLSSANVVEKQASNAEVNSR